MRWQTEATLAELDQHIAAFDNPAAEFEEDSEEEEECSGSDRDSSLCLDNSSRDEEDSSYYQPVSTVTTLKLHTWNYVHLTLSAKTMTMMKTPVVCIARHCSAFILGSFPPVLGWWWCLGGVQCCDR